MADYDIGEAFKAIENELMASMIRNFERHKAEEINEGYRWSAWQIEQLKELERYRVNNKKKFSDKFKKINSGIDDMLRMAKAAGEMKQEAAILSAIKRGFKARKASKGATAEFFRVNERKLNALIEATTNDMKRAETAILRMANDRYRKVIFNAQVYANTGAGTYEKAVDMATKDFVNAGYNCIEYANGARHTLSDYADMAIRTASKRAYLQGEGQMRQKWGISTVIMNKRGNPCPKCLPFVGKVLIDDVWSGGKQSDGPYMLMSTAIEKGLYHPRCKDSHTTYLPGISSKGAVYTDEEKEQVRKDYEAEQKKTFAHRQVERFGRLALYSLDEENQEKYRRKEEVWKNVTYKLKSIVTGGIEKRIEEFNNSLDNISDYNVQALLAQSQHRVKVKTSDSKKSYFDRNKKVIYIAKSATNGTIAHELFHEIDSTYRITESGMMKESIQKDYQYLQSFSSGYGTDIKNMLYLKYKEAFTEGRNGIKLRPEYRGISDILNGMSDGEINLGYIHSKEYWKRDKALEAETWAQFGRILYDQNEEVMDMLKFVCPNTYEEVMSALKGMVK
ncbi:MAG: phage minor capsid protein [Lachnospiraceae bacterium]|nr:phage minor capsid protein [Lachnospiraceae bacterium]